MVLVLVFADVFMKWCVVILTHAFGTVVLEPEGFLKHSS